MGEEQQRSREDRRNDVSRRTVSDRRQSIILHYELLNFDRTDKRSGADRRNGKDKRIKGVSALLP